MFPNQLLEVCVCVGGAAWVRQVWGSTVEARVGPWVTAHVSGPSCCRAEYLYLPQPGMHGLCTYIHWQTSSWPSWQEAWASGLGQGIRQVGIPGTLVSRWPMKWVRCRRSGQGCWMDRGAVPVLEWSTNVYAFDPREHCVCACTNEILSVPDREKEGISAVCIYVLRESCVQVLLKTAPGWGSMCDQSWYVLSLRVSVCLWVMCSTLLLVTPVKEKAAVTSPSLGRDPGTQAGPQWLNRICSGMEWLEEVAILLASPNTCPIHLLLK